MKIDDLTVKTSIELTFEKRQQKEYKFLGSYVPKIDGYKIFEYNLNTKELKLASFKTSEMYDPTKKAGKRELETNPNCVYIEALNLKNALKKLLQGRIFFKS